MPLKGLLAGVLAGSGADGGGELGKIVARVQQVARLSPPPPVSKLDPPTDLTFKRTTFLAAQRVGAVHAVPRGQQPDAMMIVLP